MRATPLEIPELLLVEPDVHADARGCFLETYRADRWAAAGIAASFVQDNVSVSHRGVLRGLHLQHPNGQAKLVQALHGAIFDVAVDVRVGSPTFGRWAGVVLDESNHRQLFIPAGFAHGFVVTSTEAVVAYRCSEHYAPQHELSLRWDDDDLGIAWPVSSPTLSPKDAAAPRLRDVPPHALPVWTR